MSFEALLKKIGSQNPLSNTRNLNSSAPSQTKRHLSPLNDSSNKDKADPIQRRKKGGRVFNQDAIKNPFFLSGITVQKQKCLWVYLDEDDCLQGPFSSEQMDLWFNEKLLPFDLFVGVWGRQKMVQLADFIMATYPFQKNPKIYLKKQASQA